MAVVCWLCAICVTFRMATIRVMFVGHGPSTLPEDRVINTFHFLSGGAYANDVTSALAKVATFYTGLGSGQTNHISSYLSPWVQRDAELRAYDLSTAPPRVPTVNSLTLSAALAAGGVVEECALCLSYHGAPPISPRRRGRIYIGPLCLNSDTIVAATSTNPSRPAATIVADLVTAAATLATDTGVNWVIRSKLPSENLVAITAGYVDNAFDTQRRRGPKTTARTQWLGVGI